MQFTSINNFGGLHRRALSVSAVSLTLGAGTYYFLNKSLSYKNRLVVHNSWEESNDQVLSFRRAQVNRPPP